MELPMEAQYLSTAIGGHRFNYSPSAGNSDWAGSEFHPPVGKEKRAGFSRGSGGDAETEKRTSVLPFPSDAPGGEGRTMPEGW
jgi:hypothetical protein